MIAPNYKVNSSTVQFSWHEAQWQWDKGDGHTSPIGCLSAAILPRSSSMPLHSILQCTHADYVIRFVLLCCQEEVMLLFILILGTKERLTWESIDSETECYPLNIQWEITWLGDTSRPLLGISSSLILKVTNINNIAYFKRDTHLYFSVCLASFWKYKYILKI